MSKPYYNKIAGVECIEIAQHFNFNLGNVIKYVWRAGKKDDAVKDLIKAKEYIEFEIARLEGLKVKQDLEKMDEAFNKAESYEWNFRD